MPEHNIWQFKKCIGTNLLQIVNVFYESEEDVDALAEKMIELAEL